MLRLFPPNNGPSNNKIGTRLSRRALFEVGAASALGVSSADLLNAHLLNDNAERSATVGKFGQARSCVVIFLFGGPGQQDLWDMKPQAAAEVRGEFQPCDTKVPGTQISEHLPQLSKQADKFTIIRSMRHADFEHGSASFTALTGQPHPQPGTNTPAQPDDFPNLGSVVTLQKRISEPVPEAVVLGPVMHQGNRPPMAGQNAGFLGHGYDPFRIADDPNQPDFRVSGLTAKPDISAVRLDQRRSLLDVLNDRARALDKIRAVESMDRLFQRAFGLLQSSQSQQAFALSRESNTVRDQYGRNKFGQTLLLSRRLVEAGVPLIQVNWSRSNNDEWDTHKKNYPKLKELLPRFDQGLAAFLSDLDARGLMDTTTVIALGEFGRTPRINKDAGRDHWPDCYSVVVAGGGIVSGQVIGASDAFAAYPTTEPIAPWDVAATVYHCLGIRPDMEIHDRFGRPFRISRGQVLDELL